MPGSRWPGTAPVPVATPARHEHPTSRFCSSDVRNASQGAEAAGSAGPHCSQRLGETLPSLSQAPGAPAPLGSRPFLHPRGQQSGVLSSPQSLPPSLLPPLTRTPVSQQGHPNSPGSGPQQAPSLTSAIRVKEPGGRFWGAHGATPRGGRECCGVQEQPDLPWGGGEACGQGDGDAAFAEQRRGRGVLAGHTAVAAAGCHLRAGTWAPTRAQPRLGGLGPGPGALCAA